MGPHASLVTPKERWTISLYVQELQDLEYWQTYFRMQLQNEQYEFSGKTRTISLVMVAIGLVCVAVGFITGDTERTWANLLLNNYYMVLLAFSGVMYCAIQYVAQAGWGTDRKSTRLNSSH